MQWCNLNCLFFGWGGGKEGQSHNHSPVHFVFDLFWGTRVGDKGSAMSYASFSPHKGNVLNKITTEKKLF